MNGEKSQDQLMKQGRGLVKLSVCLIILAFILVIVLLDQSFVPRNAEWWEYMKSDMFMEDYEERNKEHTDEELWELMKNGMVEDGIVPFKSGFLCWAVIQWKWGAEKAKEAQRQEQLSLAQKNAETAMAVLNEFLSEKEIYTNSVESIDCYIHKPSMFMCICADGAVDSLSEEEKKELKSRLLDAFPDTKNAVVKMYVLGEKCTAAVFAPDVNDVIEGADFPYLDENGHFSNFRQVPTFTQLYTNGFIIGYVDDLE